MTTGGLKATAKVIPAAARGEYSAALILPRGKLVRFRDRGFNRGQRVTGQRFLREFVFASLTESDDSAKHFDDLKRSFCHKFTLLVRSLTF